MLVKVTYFAYYPLGSDITINDIEIMNRYTFTNDGDDRFYLDVYNPSMTDHAGLFILIGKADRVVWHWKSNEIGEIYQEYVLTDTYVKLTRQYAGQKEVLYFH